MELWQIVILAIVQGVTEFLPISSSGHLVIVAQLMNAESVEDLNVSDVSIVLHVGSLLSILVFYFRRVLKLVTEDRRTILLIIVGTVPAVLVGLPIELKFENILESPLLSGIMLCVTAAVLLSVYFVERRDLRYEEMGTMKALLIGVSQAAAILPGLSRSGATIATGLWLGLGPRSAAGFSFLLAIPAIAGGGLLEAISLATGPPGTTPLLHLAIGAVISFVVGLASLEWLIRWLERGKLQLFALWCLPAGIGVIVWQLWG